MGTAVAQRLRCCATNRTVAGSIPAGVKWIFHWHKIIPIALWPWGQLSLQHKWVPGVFPGDKGGRCIRLTTYHHPVPLSWNLGTLTSWNPLGLSRPVIGLLYICISDMYTYCTILVQMIIITSLDHSHMCKHICVLSVLKQINCTKTRAKTHNNSFLNHISSIL